MEKRETTNTNNNGDNSNSESEASESESRSGPSSGVAPRWSEMASSWLHDVPRSPEDGSTASHASKMTQDGSSVVPT
jgi:hypothetical protein